MITPGSRIGHYEIVSHLGTGGMGAVYRARHVPLRREVALKLIQPELAPRFEREARTAALLSHPGCVRVFDYGAAPDGTLYLALELLFGPTLSESLAPGRLSIDASVRIAREMLSALAHAHERDVLHRDVKPDNVVLTARGAVLIDFGLARLRDDVPLTPVGLCVGSASYLAPECLLGRPADARADLYAVGIVLYQMLTGRLPFEGASVLDIARLQIQQAPRPPRELVPAIPPALESLILRVLAKEPGDRFPHARAMSEALVPSPLAQDALKLGRALGRELDRAP
jgi:serine/threonine-protein kinase